MDNDDGDFSLKNVLDLGGNKGDFTLLENVKDDDDIFDEEDESVTSVGREELESFIGGLQFDKILTSAKEETIDVKKTKKKFAQEREIKVKLEEKPTAVKTNSKSKQKRNKFKIQDEEISSTSHQMSPQKRGSDQDVFVQNTERKYLLIKPGIKWFDNQIVGDPQSSMPFNPLLVEKRKTYAKCLMENEVLLHRKEKDKSRKSGVQWMKTVLTSGTLTDRVAALTLTVQQAPVQSLSSLETLIHMAHKKSKRESVLGIETLKDIFQSELLLEDRKLKTFTEHPLDELETLSSGNRDSRDRRLLLWYFEDQLKEKYVNFLKALESLLIDQVAAVKKKALGIVYDLLASKPEQEKVLLNLLVNKLGDPDYKLASNASHFLTRLVSRHPNMKFVIVMEVERLLFRSHVSAKAQYYGICFLNQLFLSHEEKSLAAKLVIIYFSLFKEFIKKGEVDSKMLSALLSGVNRAFPYAKMDKEEIEEQMGALYKTVHLVNFNTSIQALMLLYQVMDISDNVSDRFYMALYRKLLDPRLKTTSKQSMFLNLLYKSIKKDTVDRRVQAFVKRLIQICGYHNPAFICGSLVLLSEVLKAKPGLLNITNTGEENDDEEDELFHDIDSEEDSQNTTSNNTVLRGREVNMDEINDDDHVKQDDDNMTLIAASHEGHRTVSSWVHRNNLSAKKNSSEQQGYDPNHRNPLYCQAHVECLWEIEKLASHYHPSVQLFAKALLNKEAINYQGNPLQDFLLIRFLDRFAYRNPKSQDKLITSTSSGAINDIRQRYTPLGIRKVAVNTTEYANMAEEDIPVEERFFHRYFSKKAAIKKSHEVDSDTGSVSDSEFDNYLDKYEKKILADEDIDFAGKLDRNKKKKKLRANESDESDEEMADEELSDEEVDFGDDNDFGGAFMSDDENNPGFDEEDVAFSDDDALDGEMNLASLGGKRKNLTDDKKLRKKQRSQANPGGLFAAAEEFAHLVDDSTGSKFDMIGSDAVSTKDNASVKQLQWERNRNHYVEGRDWKSRKSQGRNKSLKPHLKKKRQKRK